MPKFKRVARKADGGGLGSTPMRFPDQEPKTREEQSAGLFNRGITGLARSLIYAMGGDPNLPANDSSGSSLSGLPTGNLPLLTSGMRASLPTAASLDRASKPQRKASASRPGNLAVQSGQVLPKGMQASMADLGLSGISSMLSGAPAVDTLAGLPSKKLPSMISGMRVEMPEGEEQEFESLKKTGGASSAAAAIPKTKAGMKKFMQDYGKFIALGAMAGAGGKGGQIAAPIIAALPGLIEMMKGKGKAAAPVEKKNKGGFMKKGIKKFADGGRSSVEFLNPNEIARRRMIMKDPSGASPAELRSLGIELPVSDDESFMRGALAKILKSNQNISPSASRSESTSDQRRKEPVGDYEELIGYMKKKGENPSTVSRVKSEPTRSQKPVSTKKPNARLAPMPPDREYSPARIDADLSFLESMSDGDKDLMRKIALGLPSLPSSPYPRSSSESEGEGSELESLREYKSEPPQKKSKFKRFMSGIGSFVKGRSSDSSAEKKSSGGAIRKFKGGSMKGNTKDSMLTPKYKKGGSIGEISQHKKMAMGKPTPQSTGQKFAKGGTMKCATGGGVKGYGIAKKIRPTGPMN